MDTKDQQKDMYRKGELLFQVLALLDEGSVVATDILDYIFTPGFGYKGRKNLKQLKELGKKDLNGVVLLPRVQ